MLLKYSQAEKKTKFNSNARQQRGTGNMKLIVGSVLGSRVPRKTVKGIASKRPASHMRALPGTGKEEHRTPVDACDNSNDSGLGFDQHLDVGSVQAALRFPERELLWTNDHPVVKRKKLEIKLESDDANDNFSFSRAMNRSQKATLQSSGLVPECLMPSRGSAGGQGLPRTLGSSANNRSLGCGGGGTTPRTSSSRTPSRQAPLLARRPIGPVPLSSQLMGFSRDGKVQLQIASQPEQQHRARYQTEGSRGAVKDRSGNSFPIVKLVGYNKQATLQVFIGTDMGRIAPHMFYQACKVSGKNSTPCVEKKIDGTIVIEVDFDPAKDMTIICDCVGILKERNVDVEHRFPDQSGARNKKKSTRCRMVFRTTIVHPDGSTEILQTTSQPIVCTQPPGVPEICKKSLCACPCTGGMELFILGKNFLKDTRVVFQQNDIEPVWEETVQPDKEYLQQTHLVCTIPAYQHCDILEPVIVRLLVTSSGKTSEPHTFTYMPVSNPVLPPSVGSSDLPQSCLALVSPGVTLASLDLNRALNKPPLGHPGGLLLPGTPSTKTPTPILPHMANHFLSVDPTSGRQKKEIRPQRHWMSSNLGNDSSKLDNVKVREEEQNKVVGLKMMPPPPALLPICAQGSSSDVLIIPDPTPVPEPVLKTEVIDESSQGPTQLSSEELKGIDLRMKPEATVAPMATVSDLLSTQSPSLATFRQFVSNPSDAPLPTQSVQSVEKYLSHIENPASSKVGGEGVGTAPVTSATEVTRNAEPSVQEIELNKLHSTDKDLGSQFIAPVVFSSSQPSSSNLLTADIPPSGTETCDKVPFVSDLSITNIFSSSSMVEKELHKPQLVGENTLPSSVASSLLVGLNSVVPGSLSKTEYQETPLSNLAPSQSRAPTLLSSVTERTLSNFHISASHSPQSSTISVPNLLTSITETRNIMETTPSLLFSNSVSSSKVLLPSTTDAPKSEGQLMDNESGKLANTPSVGVLGNAQNLSLLSSTMTPSTTTSLNISSTANTLNGNMLAVSEAESSLLNATSSTRLDALVSSAIESRILEANQQTPEKLDVFSTSGNLINNISPESSVLNSQSQVPLNNEICTNQNNSSTPMHVQDLRPSPNVSSVSPVNSYTLNSLPTEAPITQENLILNNSVVAPFSEHILTSNSVVKNSGSLVLNSEVLDESALAMETPVSSTSSSHLVLTSPTTSPIAIKSMLIDTSNPSGEDLIGATSHQNEQLCGKNIIHSPTSSNLHLSPSSCTPPLAMKSLILNASSDGNGTQVLNSSINVKDILSSSTVNSNMPLPSRTSHCTSPIAMKKIILESTVSSEVHHSPPTQSIAVKSVLSTQPSEVGLLSEPVAVVSLPKEGALMEPMMSDHGLTSRADQSSVTSNLNLQTTTCAGPIPLATKSLASMLGTNITSDLTNNSSSLMRQNSSRVEEGKQRDIHNSEISLNNNLSSQTQSGDSLMSVFTGNDVGDNISKSQTLATNPVVATTCQTMLDNHLSGIFVSQQSTATVHSIGAIHETTNTVQQTLMSNSPLTSKLDVTEGKAQTGLFNQVLMNLAVPKSGKSSVDTDVTSEKRISKAGESAEYLVTSKMCERNGVKSPNDLDIAKLNVAQVLSQQSQEQLPQQEGVKPKELGTTSSLPVPVTEIASSEQNKETVPTPQVPIQKKLEEGMVPQELTQMSESDLLSYINPSCFDQV